MILLKSQHEWKCGPFAFPAGEYLLEAATVGSALIQNGGIEVTHLLHAPHRTEWSPYRNYDGKRILFVRSGGFGDLLFLTPLFREMKYRWPKCHLAVATTRQCMDALVGNPDVDELMDYPLPQLRFSMFDTVLWPEGLMEWDERSRRMHVVDVLEEWLELPLTQGKELRFCPGTNALEEMKRRFPKGDKLRVGIQMQANHPCRSYSPFSLSRIIAHLSLEMEVFVFGAPQDALVEPAPEVDGVCFLPSEQPALSFRESAALLSQMHGFIGPDSSLTHIAGALGIPGVAIFGPFPGDLRMRYARSLTVLQGDAPCAPCFWHGRDSLWPKGMPCEKSGHCLAMEQVSERAVVAELKRRMRV